MKNRLLKTTGKLLILIAVLLGSLTSIATASLRSNYVITVGVDRRVYIIDLNKSKVIKKSDVFPEMGRPTSIDFDKRNGRLYIGSGRGYRQRIYYPLVVLKIRGNSIKLIEKFERLEKGKEGVYEIYTLKLSPDGKELFLGYGGYEGGTAVFNSFSREIVEKLNFYIGENSIFSPDGKKVCNILSPLSIIVDGKELVAEWRQKGCVITYDIEENKEIEKIEAKDLFASGRGLNPPWEKIDTPLIRVEIMGFGSDPGHLTAYDRLTGKEIYKIDLRDTSGRPLPLNDYVLLLPDDKNKALIPLAGGYLGIIDLKEKKLAARINIGSVSTNVVFGYTRLNYMLLITIIVGAVLIIALAIFLFIRRRKRKTT